MLTNQQLEALSANVDRLLMASLARLGNEILAAPVAAAPALSADEREALALERLGTMNFDELDIPDFDALADELRAAATPDADAETIAASLAALPPGLPALTEPLSEAALAQWVAIEQARSAPLDRLITTVRRLALARSPGD